MRTRLIVTKVKEPVKGKYKTFYKFDARNENEDVLTYTTMDDALGQSLQPDMALDVEYNEQTKGNFHDYVITQVYDENGDSMIAEKEKKPEYRGKSPEEQKHIEVMNSNTCVSRILAAGQPVPQPIEVKFWNKIGLSYGMTLEELSKIMIDKKAVKK